MKLSDKQTEVIEALKKAKRKMYLSDFDLRTIDSLRRREIVELTVDQQKKEKFMSDLKNKKIKKFLNTEYMEVQLAKAS